MVELKNKAGLIMGGAVMLAGSRKKSSKMVDRDLTAGMNTKQLGAGAFSLASSDFLTNKAKQQFSPLGSYSDEALQIGMGMVASEAGNRLEGDDMGLAKPIATGMLLSGLGGAITQAGADLGSIAGGSGGTSSGMPTNTATTSNFSGASTQNYSGRTSTRVNNDMGGSSEVLDY